MTNGTWLNLRRAASSSNSCRPLFHVCHRPDKPVLAAACWLRTSNRVQWNMS
jgi:hypothetical protein